jgi:hypothetical protein
MSTAPRFQHKCIVLHVELKNFTLIARDALQGLTSESEDSLRKHGEEGWELVSVVPFQGSQRAVLAFLKRATAS